MPVEPVVRLEGDQNLLALPVIETGKKARRRLGNALAGIDGLGASTAERQEARGSQHHPASRMVLMSMRVPTVWVIVRMPAVVRHRALRQAALRPYFSEQP